MTTLQTVLAPALRASHAHEIERAAARVTVEAWGVDAIWAAPTRMGAVERAKLCLTYGCDPADVTAALERWTA